MVETQVHQQKPHKQARLEARVTKEQKALFQRAADLSGRSLTDFLLSSLQKSAEKVIKEKNILTLSERDQRAFAEAFLSETPPNEKLVKAAERYKAKI